MPRPFQHLRRAEIAEQLHANQAERDRLQEIIDRLQTEADAITGGDLDSLRRRMPLSHQILIGTREITALLKEVQAFNFELHVRDSPDLVAQFGPGAD